MSSSNLGDYSKSDQKLPELKPEFSQVETPKKSFIKRLRGIKQSKVLNFQKDGDVTQVAYKTLNSESKSRLNPFSRGRNWAKMTVEDDQGKTQEVKVKIKDVAKQFNIKNKEDLKELRELAKKDQNISNFLKRHFLAHPEKSNYSAQVEAKRVEVKEKQIDQVLSKAQGLEEKAQELRAKTRIFKRELEVNALNKKRDSLIDQIENLDREISENEKIIQLNEKADQLQLRGQDIRLGSERLLLEAKELHKTGEELEKKGSQKGNVNAQKELKRALTRFAEAEDTANRAIKLTEDEQNAGKYLKQAEDLYKSTEQLTDIMEIKAIHAKAEALEKKSEEILPKPETLYNEAAKLRQEAAKIKKTPENVNALKAKNEALKEKKQQLEDSAEKLRIEGGKLALSQDEKTRIRNFSPNSIALSELEDEVVGLYKKAAALGDISAYKKLADFYDEKVGTTQLNSEDAESLSKIFESNKSQLFEKVAVKDGIETYVRLAKSGDIEACQKLADYYRSKGGSDFEKKRALEIAEAVENYPAERMYLFAQNAPQTEKAELYAKARDLGHLGAARKIERKVANRPFPDPSPTEIMQDNLSRKEYDELFKDIVLNK